MSTNTKIFCDEPWVGVLSVTTELEAVFCPCYLKMVIGDLRRSSLPELWNSEELVTLRNSFAKGELPAICRPQLCPVAVRAKNLQPD
jgi:hypothetical protein